MKELKHYNVEWLPLKNLKWGDSTINRKLSKALVKEVARAIANTGLVIPIVANSKLEVVDGQHRCQAVLELWGNETLVPVIIDDELARKTLQLNTEKADNLQDILDKTAKILETLPDTVRIVELEKEYAIPLWAVILGEFADRIKWKSMMRDTLKLFIADDLKDISDVRQIAKQSADLLVAYETALKESVKDFEEARVVNSLALKKVKSDYSLGRGQKLLIDELPDFATRLNTALVEALSRWKSF